MKRNKEVLILAGRFIVWTTKLKALFSDLNKQCYCVLLFMLLSTNQNINAQQHFRFNASLDSIKHSGFYRIPLPATVLAKCQSSFGDLRIFDTEGNIAAYILQTENGALYSTPMIDLPIIKRKKEGDKQWHLTMENGSNRNIDRIVLTLKGTQAKRYFTLSGSDDNINWYSILENYNPEHTRFDQDNWSLYFPSSHYKYYQITLIGKDLLPIDIIKASIYSNKTIAPQYSYSPIPYHLSQKDSTNKKSYINITFDEAYSIERMTLQVSGSNYYKRHLSIFKSLNESPLLDTVISTFNGEYPRINLACKEKELCLVIDNEDNKPLKIEQVNFDQYDRYLVAYFDSTKNYKLYFGDSTLSAPSYDITSFKDSINHFISEISIGQINKISANNQQPIIATNKYKWILWPVIIFVILLLSSITFKMLKEVSSKKQGD